MEENVGRAGQTRQPVNRTLWWLLGCLLLALLFLCCLCMSLVLVWMTVVARPGGLPGALPVLPTLPASQPLRPPGSVTPEAAAPAEALGAALSAGSPVGQTAPDFSLKDLAGKEWRLSELRGRPVIINFWATWCPPCREEMPALEDAWQRHKDKDLVILAVDVDEPQELVAAFATRLKLTFPILLGSTSGRISQAYRVRFLPTSYFVDAEGIVQAYQVGGMTARDIDRNLAKIGITP